MKSDPIPACSSSIHKRKKQITPDSDDIDSSDLRRCVRERLEARLSMTINKVVISTFETLLSDFRNALANTSDPEEPDDSVYCDPKPSVTNAHTEDLPPSSVEESFQDGRDNLDEQIATQLKAVDSLEEQTDPPPNMRATKFDLALATTTTERLSELINMTSFRAPSTKLKEAWAMRMYAGWCERTNHKPYFPVEDRNLSGFIRFLAIDCGYALKGIAQIVIPAIRHLQLDQHHELSESTKFHVTKTVKELTHHPDVVIEAEGKQPLCFFDVALLISRIPKNWPTRLQDASLFLFALHTGARAITCSAVRFADILRAKRDPVNPAVLRVVVRERVTKGNPHSNHCVCIEGYPEIEHPLDAVFYLNKYVMSKGYPPLEAIVQRTHEGNRFDDLQIWPLHMDAMTERLKSRLFR